MNYYSEPDNQIKYKVKVVIEMSHYATEKTLQPLIHLIYVLKEILIISVNQNYFS